MATNVETLGSLELFKEMEYEALEDLAQIMLPLKVTEGEVLTLRGKQAQIFFIILSGNFMVSFNHDRALTLHKKGELMGLSTVITPFLYTGTVTALTEGEVLSMPGSTFWDFLQNNSALGNKILQKIKSMILERKNFFI